MAVEWEEQIILELDEIERRDRKALVVAREDLVRQLTARVARAAAHGPPSVARRLRLVPLRLHDQHSAQHRRPARSRPREAERGD